MIAFVLGLVLGGFAVGLLFLAIAAVAPWGVLSRRTALRRREFGEQLEGTVQLIAGSLRAGYGLLQSMNTVATEAIQPTSGEFGRVVVETRLGRDLIDSLDAMASRMASQDLEWIVQAIRIQREVGGDLAELLDTIASTIRERHQIRRQVQALSAEGRLSAVVLILLPLGLAGIISVTNPDYLGLLFTTEVGRILVGISAVLMIVGTLWIRRVVHVEF
jgi:tight adherence protein B